MGVATERENRWMLEHQKRVTDEILFPRGDDLLLNRKSLSVGNAAEMEKIDVHGLLFVPCCGYKWKENSRASRPGHRLICSKH
jgi:hypothetical protein